MFQLYKQRNFSDLINDTFAFFKAYGKSFFKGYFLINGGLLIVLILLMYLVGNVFLQAIWSGVSNPNGGEMIIAEYFDSNAALFTVAAIVSLILVLLITVLSYSYPVVYLSQLEKSVPDTEQLLNALWAKAGRIIAFSLLWLVTFLPILIVGGLLCFVLLIIIIGIPFAFIVIAGLFAWMYLSFFDYINNNSGYFDAMKNGFNMLFQNFWPNIGSTVIFYVIVTVIHTIVSFIPYIFGLVGLISDAATSPNQAPGTETLSTFGIMALISFMLSLLLGYVLGNLLCINQGMIYYSAREENENVSLHSEIDLIGSDSE